MTNIDSPATTSTADPPPSLRAIPPKSLPPAHHRVSFLHQAALHLELSSESSHQELLRELSRFYVASAGEIARKAQVKLHPHTKRAVCKSGKCQSVLVVG